MSAVANPPPVFTQTYKSVSVPPPGRGCYEGGCGICEKEGAEVLWSSPYSKRAHKVCVEKIATAEKDLQKTIAELFHVSEEEATSTLAHSIAIRDIKTACAPYTIMTYLEKKGEGALGHLFSGKGNHAVHKYATFENWFWVHT